jgi:hypothetical protein
MLSKSGATLSFPERETRANSWDTAGFAALLLFIVLALPSAVDYVAGFHSHAQGTAAACGIVLLGLVHRIRFERVLVISFVLGVVIVSHVIAASRFQAVSFGRAGGSLVLLAVMVGTADIFGNWLFRLPAVELARAIAIVRWIMILIAIPAILHVAPPGGYDWDKPVFPFTEPSHYAIAFAPLLIEACVRNNGWRRLAWLLVGFALAYFLQNVTLMAGVIIAAGASIPVSKPLPWILAGVVAFGMYQLPYFAERLDVSTYRSDLSTNLSVLVYVQGWEFISESFQITKGWGLGFQQLGVVPLHSLASAQIYQLAALELNEQDGGFLVAKIVSEFGVAGIVFSALYILLATVWGFRLRAIGNHKVAAAPGELFALSVFVAFSLLMFVRAGGYFDGPTMLFAAACFYLLSEKRKKKAAL